MLLEVSGISEYFTQSFLTSSTGTEMDVPRGMQYMEKAAKQGLPQAQYMVSRQQLEGYLLVQHVNLRKSGFAGVETGSFASSQKTYSCVRAH